ncbi:MAG: hypothetical protein AAGI63_05705, partial [Planctomycetota bacterium]
KSLEPIGESLSLSDSLVPESASAIGVQGKFALITSDGRCRLIESSDGTNEMIGTIGPREVEAVFYHRSANELYIAHHIDQLDVLNVDGLSLSRTIRPKLVSWRLVDKYGISPLRMVIPQTGELGETTAAMVSGKSAVAFNNPSGEEELIRYNIFRPVISCALFIFVMMSIGCVYFATRDF